MKVSTRGRYGLRAMLELARRQGESPILMSSLAETEDLPRKYLHTLLTSLRAAGLVRSVRGARGGFALSRAPSETKLSEILRAVEGPLSLVDCVADRQSCSRAGGCMAREVWLELSGTVESMLDSITLQDLIARQKGVGLRASAGSSARGPRMKERKTRRARVASRGQRRKEGKL